MARLIFQTPSRKCPLRHLNGHDVEIIAQAGHKKLRRSGIVGVYHVFVYTVGKYGIVGVAYGDELLIEKGET